MTVAVVGQEVMYEGVFDKERVEAAVCRLGLRLKDRASLYLDAVDRCQDDRVSEQLLGLALNYAERASRVSEVRQQFDIPLTPIGSANNGVNDPYMKMQNGGVSALPPSTVETFVPRLPMSITKEMREHMVRALEGVFVPHYRGEMALRAMGLLTGELTNYVDWLQGLLQLTATIQFLLGRATIVLKEEQVVNGCSLPPGSYGNGVPIVMVRGGGDRHWRVVTELFRDSGGRRLNSASLRSTATRVAVTDGREFRNIIYLFRPLIFDNNDRPRQNNLYSDGGGGGAVSLCGG